jgi:hypothetical protein
MSINWKVFLGSDFWFNVDRSGLHRSDYIIFYSGIALAAIGIILLVYKRFVKNEFVKKVVAQFASACFTIGVAEAVWFVFRNEYAKALGTKFTAAVILLIGLIWIYFPIKYLFTGYKTDMALARRKVQRDKYLSR